MSISKKLAALAGIVTLLATGLAGWSAPAHAATGDIIRVWGMKDETRLPTPTRQTAPRAGETLTQTSAAGEHPLVISSAIYKFYVDYTKPKVGQTVRLYLNGKQIKQQVQSAYGGSFEVSRSELTGVKVGWNTLTTNFSSRPFKIFYLPISAGISVYQTNGQHVKNGRLWRTACERYSQTVRCTTDTRYHPAHPWVFNNLTYLPAMTRPQWGTNPLARTGTWTSGGRSWRTECDTAATGRNGCRSYIWTNGSWVFNSMVQFKV